jgi:predicted dehydrogenase
MISPTSKPLNVAIVGCGLIGKKRAQVLAADPECRLCAAADLDMACAEALRTEIYGHDDGKRDPARPDEDRGGGDVKEGRDGPAWPAVCADWQETLAREKPDAVIISTPNKFSAAIATEAAALGMHVLCEKPLGRNISESHEMVVAATTNHVVLKTGFNHRHHPAIYKAHEVAASGTIGPVYFIRCVYGHGGRPGYEKEWRASRDVSGGGELLDQGVHVVDLFRWFLGDFDEAYGIAPTFYWNMEVEDNAFAIFRTSGGQTAMMHTSWTQWKNRFTFEIYGEAGYLIVNGLGGSYGTETLTIGKRPINRDSTPIYLGGAPEEETIVFDGPDQSWELEWKEFKAAIRERREPLGSGRDGLEANRMIAAVYLSAKGNRPVKLTEITGDRVTE